MVSKDLLTDFLLAARGESNYIVDKLDNTLTVIKLIIAPARSIGTSWSATVIPLRTYHCSLERNA